jgi:hypothetical protein
MNQFLTFECGLSTNLMHFSNLLFNLYIFLFDTAYRTFFMQACQTFILPTD